jgi:hypothetical protein
LKKAEAAWDFGTSISCVRELARFVALTAAASRAPPPVKQRVELAFSPMGMPLTKVLPAAAIDAEVVDADGAALL